MTQRNDIVLPRAVDLASLHRDVFAHLTEATGRLGPRVVVSDTALFSRVPDCPSVVALLDPADVRRVLSDPVRFALPRSAAVAADLPDALIALNRSLHSLDPHAHHAQRAPLARAVVPLDPNGIAQVDRIVGRCPLPDSFPVLASMRALTSDVAARLIFGDTAASVALGSRLSRYFARRRAATEIDRDTDDTAKAALIDAGRDAAAGLEACLGTAKAGGPALIDRLVAGGSFTPSELIGHLNILYLSSSEPLAVVLTWTVLILSQCPDLATQLLDANDDFSAFASRATPILLESMRLLPPNALMTRVVREPVTVGGFGLGVGTEVLLAPLLMHRDPAVFADPDRFDPARWRAPMPGPFQFLPFGAGAHACIGRGFAMSLLVAILRAVLRQCARPALADATSIDWRMAIQFQPAQDVKMSRNGCDFPTWQGPVRDLLSFE